MLLGVIIYTVLFCFALIVYTVLFCFALPLQKNTSKYIDVNLTEQQMNYLLIFQDSGRPQSVPAMSWLLGCFFRITDDASHTRRSNL